MKPDTYPAKEWLRIYIYSWQNDLKQSVIWTMSKAVGERINNLISVWFRVTGWIHFKWSIMRNEKDITSTTLSASSVEKAVNDDPIALSFRKKTFPRTRNMKPPSVVCRDSLEK